MSAKFRKSVVTMSGVLVSASKCLQIHFCVSRRQHQVRPQRNDLFGVAVNEDIDSARRISDITCRRILRKFRESGDSLFVHQRA